MNGARDDEREIEVLAYLITAKRFHERGIRAEITESEIAVARPMAAFLHGQGYRKHPEPRHGVSGRMVEQAITAAWGDETWREWNEQAVCEELDSMRRALEAALRVPVGEGERS